MGHSPPHGSLGSQEANYCELRSIKGNMNGMQLLPQGFVCNSPIPNIHITSECYRSQHVIDKETKFLSGSEEHIWIGGYCRLHSETLNHSPCMPPVMKSASQHSTRVTPPLFTLSRHLTSWQFTRVSIHTLRHPVKQNHTQVLPSIDHFTWPDSLHL